MIFDITPFRSDKNIGKAYNERIEVLPDDCVVVIRDPDTMYLYPEQGQIVEEMSKKLDIVDILGCSTNRLLNDNQLYKGFSEDLDVSKHVPLAHEAADHYGLSIQRTDLLAGMFMMFRKSTWKRVGGFDEGTITADRCFCDAAINAGMKIGIAKGLYLFHAYRPWANKRSQAVTSIKHLL